MLNPEDPYSRPEYTETPTLDDRAKSAIDQVAGVFSHAWRKIPSNARDFIGGATIVALMLGVLVALVAVPVSKKKEACNEICATSAKGGNVIDGQCYCYGPDGIFPLGEDR